MRIMFLGGGGIGSIFGGYLANVGVEVTLYCRAHQAQAINERGLKITGIRGEYLIRDNLTAISNVNAIQGQYDYVIIAVKSKDTIKILNETKALAKFTSSVCSLQNNIIKEEMLIQFFGREKVFGASTVEGCSLLKPGHADNHITANVTVYLGELDGLSSNRTDVLAYLFNEAGLSALAVPHIQQVLWEKLTQIASIACWAVTAFSGNPRIKMYEALQVDEGAAHFVQLTNELLSIYRHMGYSPQDFYAPLSVLRQLNDSADFEDAKKVVMTMGRNLEKNNHSGRPSMYEDIVANKQSEVDYILKPFILKARGFGINVPVLEAAYRTIKVLDAFAKD